MIQISVNLFLFSLIFYLNFKSSLCGHVHHIHRQVPHHVPHHVTRIETTFSFINYVSSYGYPVERHANIQTEDGYLLDMFRIPYGRHNMSLGMGPRPVAFLMHGLLASSENFIISGPERGLAFQLADRGYDVWLGNARGSTHCKKHVVLNPELNKEFWHFSWHEIGIYDIPAKINYIIKETTLQTMTYIGHSQGTTAFFVMASEKPSYNQHISVMVALAPVAHMSNIPHPVPRFMSQFSTSFTRISNLMGYGEFLPNNELMRLAGQALCQEQSMFQEICSNMLFLIAGYDSQQLDRAMLPFIGQTLPAGSSTKQFYHYAQGISSGAFRKYDYGVFINLVMYGAATPPAYDFSHVTAPVVLCYSQNDWLVSTEDVRKLFTLLPNMAMEYMIPYQHFNHLDFTMAKDVVDLLYVKVFEVIQTYI